MAKGKMCPVCEENRFHVNEEKACRVCWGCGFIGWRLTDPIESGGGTGYRCADCTENTLYSLIDVTGVDVYRCSTCLFVGVKPPDKK